MKKFLITIILPIMVVSLCNSAAGQADSDSLDAELIAAAERGDTAGVQQLLQKGANIEATDKWGSTPLLRAAQNDKPEVVKLLLEKGAKINAGGGGALLAAVELGNLAMVKLLLDNGADIEAMDGFGETALLKAVKRRDNDIVKLLLDKGANPGVKDRNGNTALLYAAGGGNVEVIRLLLAKGARDSVDGMALHGAALNGQAEVVKLLLENGGNIESKDRFGCTPLLVAAKEGKAEAVKQLLDGGAKIEATDDQGRTPLHAAAQRASTEVVKLLLERGAQIEAGDKDGFTPLMCAAQAGGIAYAGTPFHVEKFPAVEAVNLLLERGANIEAKDVDGQTALHRAAFLARADAAKALIARGPNLQAMDNHGNTPLSLAIVCLRGFERLTAQKPCNSLGCQQSVDVMLADKREVVRVLQEAVDQHAPSTFADFVADLQNHPRDRARRDHVVELAAALPTLPPIPENAQQRYDRACLLIQQASGPQQLDEAMNLLRGALNVAPWWRDAYYQLSRALELNGQYDLAVKNLNYYIELHPPEAEARTARSHLQEIQAKMDTATRNQQ